MIRDLIKAASDLDSQGFHVEAELMDKIIQKIALKEVEDNSDEESEDSESEEELFSMPGMEEEEEESEEETEEESEEDPVKECYEFCSDFSDEQKLMLVEMLLDDLEQE